MPSEVLKASYSTLETLDANYSSVEVFEASYYALEALEASCTTTKAIFSILKISETITLRQWHLRSARYIRDLRGQRLMPDIIQWRPMEALEADTQQ